MGHREYKPDGTRGDYIWETFADMERKTLALGSYLISLFPRVWLHRSHANLLSYYQLCMQKTMIGICGGLRPEWPVADFACSLFGFASVPIHTKAGASNT